MRRHKEDRAGSITAGLVMITVGVLFLTGQLGILSIRHVWHYWPLFLIAVGLTHLAVGEAGDRWGSGISNILLGLVFLAINFHWMDLDWGTGWPLIFVAIGATMTLRALFGRRARKIREESGAVVVEEERHV